MRKVKYRLWDGKKMFYWSVGKRNGINAICPNGAVLLSNGAIMFPEKDGSCLMEYSNVKDKNKKNVCEGDIVRFIEREVEYTGIVCWYLSGFYIEDSKTGDHYALLQLNNFEVIGNKYEGVKK